MTIHSGAMSDTHNLSVLLTDPLYHWVHGNRRALHVSIQPEQAPYNSCIFSGKLCESDVSDFEPREALQTRSHTRTTRLVNFVFGPC